MSLKDIFVTNKKTIKEDKVRLSEDSVDAQIDSVLLGYQNRASSEEGVDEGTMPSYFKTLMGEAPEDEDKSVGDEQQKATSPVDPREQKVNLDKFAQDVSNLIDNYKNLLNIKPVIINRAKNLLSQGYQQDLVEEFLSILEQDFGHSLEEKSVTDDVLPPPPGGSTGPIGL